MSVSTVLFDLGGVVFRFLPERRMDALVVRCGLTPEEIRARVWDSGFERGCERGERTLVETRAGLRLRLDLEASDAELRELWGLAFAPDVEVLAVVDDLRAELCCGLLTNNGPLTRSALEAGHPSVLARFSPALFSCELGASKPDAAAFGAALERLKTPAEDVLFVDDAEENVEAARAAGLRALLFSSAEGLRNDLGREGLLG